MKIDNKYSIRKSSVDGVELVFAEKRIKNKGTEKEQEFLYEDVRYYNNVKTALNKYCLLQLESCENFLEVLKRIDSLEKLIEKLHA